MKSIFFQKLNKTQFSGNEENFFYTSSNLDSKKYTIQRILFTQYQKQQNYIENHYYFARQDNLISYFNCWKQLDVISTVDKNVNTKQKEKKRQKRKMTDIMKRKSTVEIQITNPAIKNKQKQETHNQLTKKVQIVYIQLQYFSQIDLPIDFNGIRDLMIIIYLLGRKVQLKTGILPCLIPVKSQQNDKIKFYKKGINIEKELYHLMKYLCQGRQQQFLSSWQQNLAKTVHKAEINKDQALIGGLLKIVVQEFISKSHKICLSNQQQKLCKIETAHITKYQTLKMVQSQIQINLDQYKITYLLKSENDRQLTLTHEIFDQYILFGKKNNFIVKWLYQMST